MQPFLFGLGTGKDNVRLPVHAAGQAVSRKEPLYVDILGADGKETAFLKGMGEDIVAGKAPVSHKDRKAAINITVYQLADGRQIRF